MMRATCLQESYLAKASSSWPTVRARVVLGRRIPPPEDVDAAILPLMSQAATPLRITFAEYLCIEESGELKHESSTARFSPSPGEHPSMP